MANLLILPTKLLIQTPLTDWKKTVGNETILFSEDHPTVRDYLKKGENPFFKTELFRNLSENDWMELCALELSQKFSLKKIIPMAEADLMRAAQLREKLEMAGPGTKQMEFFRDKNLMKQQAKSRGILTSSFAKVNSAIELRDFIQSVGYPIVIKPIAGRGSLSTFIVKDEKELQKKLEQGLFSKVTVSPDWLAERFVSGNIYHIDGLILNGKTVLISPARYLNNCLDFVGGKALGSYVLQPTHPLGKRLVVFVEKLISDFPFPKDTPFHIEVFHTDEDEILLCEINCRIGGNGINNEIRTSYNFDLKLNYIASHCLENFEPVLPEWQNKVAGRLLIPPQNGVLKSFPEKFPFEWIEAIESRAEIGVCYSPMKMSNTELVNFSIVASNEEEMENRINSLLEFCSQSITWQR